MKEKIICPKCGNDNFMLLSSNAFENTIYIVCKHCNIMFSETGLLRKPIYKNRFPNLLE